MLERATDQASGLRALFADARSPRVTVVDTSDPDAACASVTLGVEIAKRGSRVLVLDATAGEAALALRCRARYELAHVLSRDKCIDDVLLPARDGVTVLPARRALARLDDAPYSWREAVQAALGSMRFDVWLVNGAPATLQHEPLLIVATPTRVSITNAYARVKAFAQRTPGGELDLVVDAATDADARATYERIAAASRRFLAARVRYGGRLVRETPRASAARSNASLLTELIERLTGTPPAPVAAAA